MAQRARVVELYKSLLRYGKDYEHGYDHFKKKLSDSFRKNKHLTNEEEIELSILYGQYILKELEALQLLKKYQKLKRAYNAKVGNKEKNINKKDE